MLSRGKKNIDQRISISNLSTETQIIIIVIVCIHFSLQVPWEKFRKSQKSYLTSKFLAGLCSSRARWPLVPNFCPRATRKSQIFHTNHMLGTLDFTVSEHWAPFNFPQSTALSCLQNCNSWQYLYCFLCT